jgi:hypothetical protein
MAQTALRHQRGTPKGKSMALFSAPTFSTDGARWRNGTERDTAERPRWLSVLRNFSGRTDSLSETPEQAVGHRTICVGLPCPMAAENLDISPLFLNHY